VCLDVTLRRSGDRKVIHLVNRASGVPNQPGNGAIDEIPAVGPISITMRQAEPPGSVSLAFEKGGLEWSHARGTLRVSVPSVHIHAAVVVE
jgi:hypothetical protein